MIVRNEAHVVTEVLDAVAPYIKTWVIVDTGSTDGTQDLIRTHLARHGVSGELHERPWRNFGHNRTEALALAQGHADYVWVMDADDTIVGAPDFTHLDADVYWMRCTDSVGFTYLLPLLFRDGVRVCYKGVTHERASWDYDNAVDGRLEGDYYIHDRHISDRNMSGRKHALDRDLLLAELERNPEDGQSAYHLAQTYFNLGDFANACKWYGRRVEIGGFPEIVYSAMYWIARSMQESGAPWPEVQDAFLRAWEFRPTRAEPLYCIARQYRIEQRYQLGYLFAKRAAAIPFPEREVSLVGADVYEWRAVDEQAVCASWIDKHAEAFGLYRQLLGRPDIPDEDRQRIAGNRDACAPTMIDAAAVYPEALVRSLRRPLGGSFEVVVSLIAGPVRAGTEHMLNSFLRCCTDISRVGRFLAIDAGLSAQDREILCQRYEFLEFTDSAGGDIRDRVDARFWLHLGHDWQFFAPENLITRLTAVLDAEPQVFQVGVNYIDAVTLTGGCAPEQAVRRVPEAGRYMLTDRIAAGPAMFDTARLDRGGTGTASLDEVLCITAIAG
jgi:glycosyltransferase involved in cell wall biosynthesis